MARIHGYNGKVEWDPAGGTSFVELGDASKFTLDMTRERARVTAFGDTNHQKVQGLPDFTGTISAFWNINTSPTLFGVVLGTVAPNLRLIPNRLEPTGYFQGLAYLDGSIDADVNGPVTIASSFDAAGNWTKNP